MLISAPPPPGHPGVSRSEASAEEGRQRTPTVGRVTRPSIRMHLNNDSHLSGSRRWGLINTRLTCPLTLACDSSHRSPPRCCLSLLHEITGLLFPVWSPLRVHTAKPPRDKRRKRAGLGPDLGGKGTVRSRKKAPGFTNRERSADGTSENWAIHTPARDVRVWSRVPDTPTPPCYPQWRHLLDRNGLRSQIHFPLCFL